MLRRLLPLAGLALLAACAQPVEEAPVDPGTVIVQVRTGGGLALMGDAARVPRVTVFGDGTMVLAERDEGTLQTASRRTLPPARIREMFERVSAAGLFADEEHEVTSRTAPC